ncbi:hypothetical protein [Pseudomonas sp. MPB23]|uniref:hypothetical protein n=1 Tax=Pseudomonas sp. MPB23 TaxID=3388490 RepID=UPI00398562A7
MLAKIVNDNAALQRVRVAWVFFASKLAPTEGAKQNGTLGAVLSFMPGWGY